MMAYKFVFLQITLIICISCGRSTENEVKSSTINFARAFYSLNFQEAKKYCISGTSPEFDYYVSNITQESIDALKKAGEVQVEILDININNESLSARVKCRVTNYLKINPIEGTSIVEKQSEKIYNLKKSGKDWLIDLH